MNADEVARLRRDFLLEGNPAPVVAPVSVPGGEAERHARQRCVVAIGAFDGFHRGHQQLLELACADARARGVRAVAVTFDPDPDCVVRAQPAQKLLTTPDRLRALATSGVDEVLVVPFDAQVAALDHRAFFERFIFPSCDVAAVHVGADFKLGAGGRSTVEVMRPWLEERGVELLGHELLRCDGAPVTATRVRAQVAASNLEGVERALGRRYFVRGVVAAGRHAGASLGFPTANVELPSTVQRPGAGVYAGYAFDGRRAWPAAINVGVPPTFQGEEGVAELEANILGFSGDIYGCPLALLFTDFLRFQRVFSSVDELVATVSGNIEDVRARLGDSPVVLVP